MSVDLTPVEISRLLRVAPTRVRRWIRNGELAAVNVSDSDRPRYMISQEDYADFRRRRSGESVEDDRGQGLPSVEAIV